MSLDVDDRRNGETQHTAGTRSAEIAYDDRELLLLLDRLARAFHSPRLASRIVLSAGLRADAATMRVLGRVNGQGPTTATEIAAALGVSTSTISRHLRELDRHGLLERHENPDDGRSQLISPSAAGREVIAQLRRAWVDMAEEVFGTWTDDDRDRLVDLAERIITTCNDRANGPDVQLT